MADGVRLRALERDDLEFVHRLTPDHQRHRYATVAPRHALDHAFAVLNRHEVYLIVSTENLGAVRICTRAGLAVDGTPREEFLADARSRDALRMSLLQREHLPV